MKDWTTFKSLASSSLVSWQQNWTWPYFASVPCITFSSVLFAGAASIRWRTGLHPSPWRQAIWFLDNQTEPDPTSLPCGGHTFPPPAYSHEHRSTREAMGSLRWRHSNGFLKQIIVSHLVCCRICKQRIIAWMENFRNNPESRVLFGKWI